MFDPSQLLLRLSIQFLDTSENKIIDDTTKISTVDAPIYTLFDSVDIYCRGEPKRHYPSFNYMIYNSLITGVSKQQESTWLRDTAAFFIPDEVDLSEVDSTQFNPSLAFREQRMRLSKQLDMEAKILIPIFNICQLLPCLCDWDIRLNLCKQNWCCVFPSKDDSQKYGLYITRAELKVTKISLTDLGNTSFMKSLNSGLQMTYTDLELVTFSLTKGAREFTTPYYPPKGLVRRVFLSLIEEDRFLGQVQKNPIVYQPFHFEKIKFSINEKDYVINANYESTIDTDNICPYFALIR
jgi:hypothetical protein